DKSGNINSHWVSDNVYVTGSGGANDVATGAAETMVIMQQSRSRFLEKVPFVTAPGNKVRALVSNMGVFEKMGDDEEFTLTIYFERPGFSSTEEVVRNIKDNCGWALKVAEELKKLSPPTRDELRLLRVFDPNRYYLK
ncbi:MAG: hypothetical protein Q7J01_06300, partial [Syntrophales bacterium]|nr:hypothetical protein [Syntrophales bacterium]